MGVIGTHILGKGRSQWVRDGDIRKSDSGSIARLSNVTNALPLTISAAI